MSERAQPFDPLTIIDALDRHRVAFVLIGTLAGVIHGTDEIANRVEICPQVKIENLERLSGALAELDAKPSRRGGTGIDAESLGTAPMVELKSAAGAVSIVLEPPGATGYDDLRRKATREPLGRGVRAPVARVDDLARLLAATETADVTRLATLRAIAERDLSRGISR